MNFGSASSSRILRNLLYSHMMMSRALLATGATAAAAATALSILDDVKEWGLKRDLATLRKVLPAALRITAMERSGTMSVADIFAACATTHPHAEFVAFENAS